MIHRLVSRTTAYSLAVLAALAAAGEEAHASDGAAPIAIGARAAGRGGVDTAISDDAISGVHHNPAGMLLGTDRMRVDLQDMITYAAARYLDSRNDISESGASAFAPAVGIAFDPRWGDETDLPIRIGFGIAGHYGTSGDTKVKTEVYPEGVKESLDFALVKAGPTFAIEPFMGLRLGLGVFYNYFVISTSSSTSSDSGSTAGIVRDFSQDPENPQNVIVDGEQVTWNDLFSVAGGGNSTAALFEFEEGAVHGVSFNLGVQYDIIDIVTVGLSYTSPTWWLTDLTGDGKIDASRSLDNLRNDPDVQAIIGPVLDSYLPGGQNADFTARYKYTLTGLTPPQIVSLGVAVRPIDELQIALDGRWMQWSTMFRRIDADLTGGSSADINEIYGSDRIQTGTQPRWRDMWVLAAGASFSPIDALTLRLGYNYAKNPIPEDRISPGAIAYLEHHITTGASFRFNDNWSATLALVYNLRESGKVDVHASTPDYSDSSHAAEQGFIYLGVALDL